MALNNPIFCLNRTKTNSRHCQSGFGFPADADAKRGSFNGMATHDDHTQAAHFDLLNEMWLAGQAFLTAQQKPRVQISFRRYAKRKPWRTASVGER